MNVCPGYTTSIVVSLLGNRLMGQPTTVRGDGGKKSEISHSCVFKT